MSKSARDVDGGWAWVVLACSFMNLLVSTGIASVSGIFQKLFLGEFQESVAFTAWVTALFSSFMQLAGPLSGILMSATSCRTTVMVGGALLTLGLAVSSFAKSMAILFVTFGLCGGLGLGLLYTPSIVVVNFFFDHRRTVATGVALSAGGLGTIGIPILSRYLIDQLTWQEALLVLACLSAHTCVFGALMFPIHEPTSRCGRLYHRCLGRDRKKHSQAVQRQNEALRMFVLDTGKSEVDGKVETFVKHDHMMNLHSDTLQQPVHSEHSDAKLLNHEEHQTAGVSALQRSLPHLQNEDMTFACTHGNDEPASLGDDERQEEEALLVEDERQEDKATPLVQHSVPNLLCSEDTVTGTRHPENIKINDQTTVNSLTDANKVCKLKNSLPDSHFLDEEAANVSGDNRQTTPGSKSITSLQGAEPHLENLLNLGPESSRERASNLVIFQNLPFIMLCVNLFLSNSACGICLIHLPAFCAQRGIDDQAVAFILAVNGVALFLSRILLGGLGNNENIDQLTVYFGLHVISSFNLMMLSFAENMASVSAILMLMGVYYGSVYSLLSSLTVSLVGLPQLPFAFGVEMISAGTGYLVAPPLAGLIVDETGNYNNTMYLGGFLLFLSAIAVAFMTCGRK